MVKRDYTIENASGLHARPVSLIVAAASKYSEVTMSLYKKGQAVDLKSILGVMSLSIGQYDEITIEATGSQAEEALNSVEKVMVENQLI